MNKIISIQSHVVHGYVGNKAAVFCLNLLGYEVDAINTVHLSNHTGYKDYSGQRLTGKEFEDIVKCLEKNGFTNYSNILLGYIGTKSCMESLVNFLKIQNTKSKKPIIIVDPVMGDYDDKNNQHGLYVPKEFVEIYRKIIIPMATVITPNKYEAELLTNMKKIQTIQDAFTACDILHQKGVKTVIITSLNIKTCNYNNTCDLVASVYTEKNTTRLIYQIPQIPIYLSGCGDVLAALITGLLDKYPQDIKTILDRVLSSLHRIIERTYQQKQTELCLIESKNVIENPEIFIKGQYYESKIN